MALSTRTILFGTNVKPVNQKELAKAVGVSPMTISNWKRDPTKIPLGNLRRMTRVLGLTDEQIISMVRER